MFYLGTHHPAWLARAGVPLFISRRRLVSIKKLPRATTDWCLDSGGFTELKLNGRWSITATEYITEVRRIRDDIGKLVWAAPMDWMCEPVMLAKTGLTVLEHQARTIRSVQLLRALASDITWIPVLQGWEPDDYLRHIDAYASVGMLLENEPTVGLGSVCRRQNTDEFATIVRSLHARGIKIHGFGVKTQGLARVADLLQSSDSLAWSAVARYMRRPGLPECVGGTHINCANCLPFALAWRTKLLAKLPKTWAA